MFKPTIGLEVHIELETKTKMFCSCLNDSEEKAPNKNVCPICMGHPGTLPVINEEAVNNVIKTGLAFGSQIPENSKFDRKNYFYPDLPKGYQISQYDLPLCAGGSLEIGGKKIRIRRVHLEEDTGRLIHPPGADYSLVDFNRAGVPLMELVTEPDIASSREASDFAQELQLILRYLGVSKADMEKGQLRVEANISIGKGEKLGTKVEIKNLNSFKAVEKGIDYEIKRQTELLESGKKIIQETRGWNDEKGTTFSQREKEEAHDYRYFPEPDLLPLSHSAIFINEIKSSIPELPAQRRERLKREYGLDEKEAELLTKNKDLGEYFEKVVSEFDPNLSRDKLNDLINTSANYLISDLQGLLRGVSVADSDFRITAENFADFIDLINEGKISSKMAKIILAEMFSSGDDPKHIIEEKGLTQITDLGEIEKIIKDIVDKNPRVVEDYKKGKANALQFLVGQVMAETKGKANPQIVNKILKDTLT
ncbi:MAG: Asp-tRNA(Asn)/Glu-tRNA(Gln) amidotransferase subunit GatB [Candidatus Pacebacteria bacterium]|nr:Asp-tRNA(Asn)/Glu-tRNA(Gln) amidotransferase subunit GatB [Candidatus Paceibacterota bacterium]